MFGLCGVFSGSIMLIAGEKPKVVACIIVATFIPALAMFALTFPDVIIK